MSRGGNLSIPSTVGQLGLLPVGRHTATLPEVEAAFVGGAPYASERATIWAAFVAWHAAVSAMLPNARFWIDGGFATHKTWSAPKDIDVVILVASADLNALSPAEQDRFSRLLTIDPPGGPRIQPMGDLVHAFYVVRSMPDRTAYWHETWSKVKGDDGAIQAGINKGYLEVKP